MLSCDFCGKPNGDVELMITAGRGTTVAICDECVALCVEIIAERLNKKLGKGK